MAVICRSGSWLLILVLSTALFGEMAVRLRAANQAGNDVATAIDRIRGGPHSRLPDLEKRIATGPVGRGVTIENGTSQVLTAYFRGAVVRTVEIQGQASTDVELTVGRYEVAAEMRDGGALPFYGELIFESDAHYWLRFFAQSTLATRSTDPVSIRPSGAGGPISAAEGELEPSVHSQLPRTFVPLRQKIAFHGAEIIGYSRGATLRERTTGARLDAQPGYRFVVIEIEYARGPVTFNPLWFDEILLSTDRRSHSWIGLPIRSDLDGALAPTTFRPFAFPVDARATFDAQRFPGLYLGVAFQIELSEKRLLLRFRDEWVALLIEEQ